MVVATESQEWIPPQEMVKAIREALAAFPEVAAAFIWMWEGSFHNVLVVLNCRDPGCCTVICSDKDLKVRFRKYTKLLRRRFPDLTFSDEHWRKWRKQDGFGGYRMVYLRR